MNKEIKEILDFKEDADYKRLSVDEIKILEDYITNLEQKVDRLLKTQKMYEERCNKIHEYIIQNCEIIRHKDYDEVGKVNGGHILYLLAENNNNTPTENLYKYTPEKGFRLVGDDNE